MKDRFLNFRNFLTIGDRGIGSGRLPKGGPPPLPVCGEKFGFFFGQLEIKEMEIEMKINNTNIE